MCVMALRVNDIGFRSSSYHDRENLWQSLSGLECHREEGDKVFNLLIEFDMLVCCGLFGYIYIYCLMHRKLVQHKYSRSILSDFNRLLAKRRMRFELSILRLCEIGSFVKV